LGTDILADLKDFAEAAVEDQWHQERVGEQIDLVNGAIAEIERLGAAEKSKRP
jgi:hypothetical protein